MSASHDLLYSTYMFNEYSKLKHVWGVILTSKTKFTFQDLRTNFHLRFSNIAKKVLFVSLSFKAKVWYLPSRDFA